MVRHQGRGVRADGSRAENEQMEGGEHIEKWYLSAPLLAGKSRFNAGSWDIERQ